MVRRHVACVAAMLAFVAAGDLSHRRLTGEQERTRSFTPFFNIGCTKCGTTSFHHYLLHHPGVAPTCSRFHLVASERRRVALNAQLSNEAERAALRLASTLPLDSALAEVSRRWAATTEPADTHRMYGANLDGAYVALQRYVNFAQAVLMSRYEAALEGGRGGGALAALALQFRQAGRAVNAMTNAVNGEELSRGDGAAAAALRRFEQAQREKLRHLNGTLAPVVCDPGKQLYVKKEPKFFGGSRRLHGGAERYAENYVHVHSVAKPLEPPPAVGDFTACTIYGCEAAAPLVVARDLAATLPGVKLLALVCDPARRARSYLRMTCSARPPVDPAPDGRAAPGRRRSLTMTGAGGGDAARGEHWCDEPLERSVAVAMRQLDAANCSLQLYRADRAAWVSGSGCLEKPLPAAARALVRSFFGDYLEPWLRVFGGDALLVVQTEALRHGGQEVMDGVHAHLGLAPFRYDPALFHGHLNVARAKRQSTQRFVPEGAAGRLSDAVYLREQRTMSALFAAPTAYMCELLQSHGSVTSPSLSLCRRAGPAPLGAVIPPARPPEFAHGRW